MASKQAFVIFFRSQPSELYAVESNRYFMTRRFDRDGEKKAHTLLTAVFLQEMHFKSSETNTTAYLCTDKTRTAATGIELFSGKLNQEN